MADHGTVTVDTDTLVEVSAFAPTGMDYGVVFDLGAPAEPSAPTVPTTGQIWPRGNP
jgi:hypothetical protein